MDNIYLKLKKEYLGGKSPLKMDTLNRILYELSITQEIPSKYDLLENIWKFTIGYCQVLNLQMPNSYESTFLKYVIKKVSNLGLENEDDLLELWYERLKFLCLHPNNQFYRIYEFSNKELTTIVKIYENENTFVSEGTTGLITWEACLELIEWFFVDFKYKNTSNWIFELGCGTGLLAMTILHSFPNIKGYIATDGSESVINNCKFNYASNSNLNLEGKAFTCESLNWIHDEDKFCKIMEKQMNLYGRGLLIGTDVIFDDSVIPSLVHLIDLFLKNGNLALISTKIRNEDTLHHFYNELKACHRSYEIQKTWTNEGENGIIFEII